MRYVSNGVKVLFGILIAIVIFGVFVAMTWYSNQKNQQVIQDRKAAFALEVLQADSFEDLEISQGTIQDVYRCYGADGQVTGYVVFQTVEGYAGPLEVNVAVDPFGETIKALRVGANNETENLGKKTTEPEFYQQFQDRSVPLVLNRDVMLSQDNAAKPMADGSYEAQTEDYVNGFLYHMSVTVENGAITNVHWDGVTPEGVSKRQMSENGEYVMTENGLLWHQQIDAMEDYLISLQDPLKIAMNEEGKVDAVSGVSISVSDFVYLAQECVDAAKGVQADAGNAENVIQAVSGASISSRAVTEAANQAAMFISEQKAAGAL